MYVLNKRVVCRSVLLSRKLLSDSKTGFGQKIGSIMERTKGTIMSTEEKKKQKTHLPPNEVTSREKFEEFYGKKYGYQLDIYKRPTLTLPTRWESSNAKSFIVAFLKMTTPDWRTTFDVLPADKRTEAEVEPILFEMIKPIVAMTQFVVTPMFANDSRHTVDDVATAATNAIFSSTRPAETRNTADLESEHAEEASMTINFGADLRDPAELTSIYFALEYFISKIEDGTKGGRVEFLLMDETTKTSHAVIEAKLNNPIEGIYQCASYMTMLAVKEKSEGKLRTQPMWGIVTDSKEWYFLKLEGNRIQMTVDFHLFMQRDILSRSALEIFGFLFEIMGIPPTFNIKSYKVDHKTRKEEFRSKLLSDFVKDYSALFP